MPCSAADSWARAETSFRLLLRARSIASCSVAGSAGIGERLEAVLERFGAAPGEFVEIFVDTPLAERDESWVFTRTAEFIRWPDIRTAFALAPAHLLGDRIDAVRLMAAGLIEAEIPLDRLVLLAPALEFRDDLRQFGQRLRQRGQRQQPAQHGGSLRLGERVRERRGENQLHLVADATLMEEVISEEKEFERCDGTFDWHLGHVDDQPSARPSLQASPESSSAMRRKSRCARASAWGWTPRSSS